MMLYVFKMVVCKIIRDPGIKLIFEGRKGNKSLIWHLFFLPPEI
jgi:hypothetical protein